MDQIIEMIKGIDWEQVIATVKDIVAKIEESGIIDKAIAAVKEDVVSVHTSVISENFFSVGNSCYSDFAGSEFNVGGVHNDLESGKTGSKGLVFVADGIEFNFKVRFGYIMGVGSCASGYGKHNENEAEHYGKHFFHIDKHPFCISNGNYNIYQEKKQTNFRFLK